MWYKKILKNSLFDIENFLEKHSGQFSFPYHYSITTITPREQLLGNSLRSNFVLDKLFYIKDELI